MLKWREHRLKPYFECDGAGLCSMRCVSLLREDKTMRAIRTGGRVTHWSLRGDSECVSDHKLGCGVPEP